MRLADLDLMSQRYDELGDGVKVLEEVSHDYYGKTDLEFIVSILLQLEKANFRDFIECKHKRMQSITHEKLTYIRILINDYIRRECEKIDTTSMEYLWPLTGLIPGDRFIKRL